MIDRVRALDDDETAAAAIGAGGVLAAVTGTIVDSRALRLVGLAAALGGGGLYARIKLAARSEKIHAAEESIRSELDELDPVARAQVIAGIARDQLH